MRKAQPEQIWSGLPRIAAVNADIAESSVAGRMMVLIEVDGAMIDFMIATRWLREDEAGDKRAIGEAITEMVRYSMMHEAREARRR